MTIDGGVMKVIPTSLHVWKVWLNSFIEASESNEWYLYVLAPTALRAARIAVTYWKQEHGEAVAISVKLVCSSVILEPTIVVKHCAKYEKERKEEIQRQKDLDALRAKSK